MMESVLTREMLTTFERQWEHPMCARPRCRWLNEAGAKFCCECGARIWRDFDGAGPLRRLWRRLCEGLGGLAR